MERSIQEQAGMYDGYDIYVVASGPSAGFIEPEFFDNKVAIGVNEAWLRFPNLDYLVRKEAERSQAAYMSGIPLVISRHNCGVLAYALNRLDGPSDYYVFEHADNQLSNVDLSVIGTDKLIVSWSTITSAMHLAAYMGAANIILVGHDCGLIDGQHNMQGYPTALNGEKFYLDWLTKIEPQSILVRAALQEHYGCRIYSLNPFLNLGMEGHEYSRR